MNPATSSADCDCHTAGRWELLDRVAAHPDGPEFLHRCRRCGTLWHETLRFIVPVDPQRARELFPGEFAAPAVPYRSGKDDASLPGATLPARVGGVVGAVALVAFGLYTCFETGRGRFYAVYLLQPAVLLSFGGAVFCVLTALGVIGRHARR